MWFYCNTAASALAPTTTDIRLAPLLASPLTQKCSYIQLDYIECKMDGNWKSNVWTWVTATTVPSNITNDFSAVWQGVAEHMYKCEHFECHAAKRSSHLNGKTGPIVMYFHVRLPKRCRRKQNKNVVRPPDKRTKERDWRFYYIICKFMTLCVSQTEQVNNVSRWYEEGSSRFADMLALSAVLSPVVRWERRRCGTTSVVVRIVVCSDG